MPNLQAVEFSAFIPDFTIRQYGEIWDEHGNFPTPKSAASGITHVIFTFCTAGSIAKYRTTMGSFQLCICNLILHANFCDDRLQ